MSPCPHSALPAAGTDDVRGAELDLDEARTWLEQYYAEKPPGRPAMETRWEEVKTEVSRATA